jgi:hypothetical protein
MKSIRDMKELILLKKLLQGLEVSLKVKLKIPKKMATIIAGVIWFLWSGYTFDTIHGFLIDALNNKRSQTASIIVLVVVGFIHAILSSLKKNFDSYGKKNIVDIYVWLSSTFTVIGTGFLAFTCLKIFCGLLGEVACEIPFLAKKDEFTLWPFIIITFLAFLYCAIKMGTIIGEIIELGKTLFHTSSEQQVEEEMEELEDNETPRGEPSNSN